MPQTFCISITLGVYFIFPQESIFKHCLPFMMYMSLHFSLQEDFTETPS